MSYATRTLTGTFQTPGGDTDNGTITIVADTVIKDTAGKVIMSGRVTDDLVGGSFEIDLPVSGDPGLTPSVFSYTVWPSLRRGHVEPVTFELTAGDGPLDLADVVPTTPPPPPVPDAETIAGAQAKADAAETDAKAYTDAQLAPVTTALAGKADAAQLATKADVSRVTSLEDLTNTGRLSQTALSGTFVPQWKPSTAYSAGQAVLNPSGDIVTAKAAFTSGATYSAANWNPSPTYATKSEVVKIGSSVTDAAGAATSMLNLEHYSNGSGNTTSPGQTYAIDLHNNPGARAAYVIHQYSNVDPAFWLDNTDSNDAIYVHNTQNLNRNPTGDGTGNFMRLVDHGTTRFTFSGQGTLTIAPKATATGNALLISHGNTATAISINSTSAATGWYTISAAGYDQGANFSTSQNFGVTMNITKNGTGSGDVLRVTNKGTGPSVLVKNATVSVAQVNPDGEFEHLTAGKGLLLRSPDGTRYRVSVANGGTVSVVAAP